MATGEWFDAIVDPISPTRDPRREETRQVSKFDLSTETYSQALRDLAIEELEVVRARYQGHRDPVRCAFGISLVLRSFAKDIFGEDRISRLRRIGWLNFLVRTSDEHLLQPDVIETMSAALYADPIGVALPGDCSFWFDAAQRWIEYQEHHRPITTCEASFGRNL